MTNKIYTAREMREMASFFDRNADQFSKARSNSVLARIPETISMLRQAAKLMEREEKREKKYEYETVELYKDGKSTGKALVRREVGEWEEVKA